MTPPAWKVSDLLLVVLTAGLAFGAFRSAWEPPPDTNAWLLLTTYLALLATATLGAFLGRPSLRRPCRGYAAFGWCHLVCVLQGGFGLANRNDYMSIARCSQVGMAFGVACAMAAAWILEPPRPSGVPAPPATGSEPSRGVLEE